MVIMVLKNGERSKTKAYNHESGKFTLVIPESRIQVDV